MSPAPYCTVGIPAAFRMLPSPTLPMRPQAPTTGSAPEASRWPSASAVPSGWVRVGRVREPAVRRNGLEALADAPDDLALLLDRVPVACLRLGAVAEEQVGGAGPDPHHDDADADVGDRVGGVLHVDREIRPDAV